MHQLVESGLVLSSHGALSNEGGVGGKDDSLTHPPVPLATDLPIVKLKRGWGRDRGRERGRGKERGGEGKRERGALKRVSCQYQLSVKEEITPCSVNRFRSSLLLHL